MSRFNEVNNFYCFIKDICKLTLCVCVMCICVSEHEVMNNTVNSDSLVPLSSFRLKYQNWFCIISININTVVPG